MRARNMQRSLERNIKESMKVVEDRVITNNRDILPGDAHDGRFSKDNVHDNNLSKTWGNDEDLEGVKKIEMQELAQNQNQSQKLDSSILSMIDQVRQVHAVIGESSQC